MRRRSRWCASWMVFLVVASLVGGCGKKARRMEHPEDPQGRYREQIQAARRVLEQRENWADRVEWEVQKQGNEWHVYAWRVDYPERKGPLRYLPWGYSLIIIDNRGKPSHYERKG